MISFQNPLRIVIRKYIAQLVMFKSLRENSPSLILSVQLSAYDEYRI
jgi:hypothetical protein